MSRVVTNNDTIRLVPSAYGRSNATYVTVTNPENMYYNTDHTSNYCTLRGRGGRSSNSTYYAFINGFNFDDVPEEATVTGFNVKIRAYRSQYQAAGNTNYRISLASQASNSYKIGNTTLSSDLATTSDVYEIPTGSLTWDTLKSYGSGFSIDIPLRNSSTSSNNYPYIYVYGAEIAVDYTNQVTQYSVSLSNSASGITVSPSIQQWINEDADHIITFTNVTDIATLSVVDNNVNVTSQLVNTGTRTYTYTISNISADHTITVATVTAYNITASSEVPSIATVDPSSGRVGQGNSFSINITKAENRNSIRVYDNNVDVTNQLAIGQILVSKTDTFVPSSYSNVSNFTVSNPANGYTDSNSTTSGTFTLSTSTTGYAYYDFDVSSIPNDAIIDSVSCSVRIRVSGTSRVTNTGVQLYSGNNAKGSSSTFASTSSTNTVNLITGTWTRNELNNIKIRFTGTGSTSSSTKAVYFYGATLTINYRAYEDSDVIKKYTINDIQGAHNVVVRENTNYTLTTSSSFANASISPASKKVYDGENYEATITVDDINSIVVKDNGIDVTSTFKSQYNDSDTIHILGSYIDGTLSVSNASNAYKTINTSSTQYATLQNTGAAVQYSNFKFDTSSIPETATIKSVSCRVQICRSSTTTTMSNINVRLQCNGTDKGSAATINSSTSASNIVSITNAGTWTREELNNCILRCQVQIQSGTASLRLYAAELTVNYEYCGYSLTNVTAVHNIVVEEAPYKLISGDSSLTGAGFSNLPKKIYVNGESFIVSLSGISNRYSFRLSDNGNDVTSSVNVTNYQYTISNITADHELLITEAPKYPVSGTSNFTGKSITGTGNVYHGDSITVTLTNITNTKSFKLYDNNVDVTSSVNTSNWTYSLTNVTAAHTLRLEEATKYEVTGTSNLSGAGFSGLGNVYQGDNITITLTGITNTYSFRLYDNDTDVTSSVNTSNWRYTISNAQGTHALRIEESTYYAITGTSTYTGASISGLTNKAYEGDSITVTLVGISDPDSFRLYDNGFLATGSVTSNYQFTISDIQVDHDLLLEEIPHYSVTEGNSTLQDASLVGLTNNVYEGTDVVISIEGVSNPYSIKLLDNGVDVSDQLVLPTAVDDATYEVTTAPNASYGFDLSTNAGYYISTNEGQASSAAVARVTFDLPVRSRITIKYINYAEGTYDYGIFGNIDSALGTTSTVDSDVKYACSSSSDNTADEQTLTYDIDSGEHFIDIKFRKDTYTDENYDSLQFKIDSITPLETLVLDTTYTITNISENHVLVVSLQDTITVTTSSSYNGASLSPASSTVYKGEPVELTLSVSDISLVSVRVTNSKNSMVTGIFTDNGNGTYTGILTVRENSTVTVIQKVTYTITCTDNATNGNITPTGTQSIDGGYDVEYVIESDYFNRIYLKDNNVIVNDLIERHNTSSTTATFIPSEYDSVNSNHAGADSTNGVANGLTNADSTTRATFLTNSTANSETNIYYNFDCSSIPENAIITNVSCEFKAAISSNYFSTRIGQLCCGTTKKGSPSTVVNASATSGTPSKQTMADCGTWTRAELNNIKILIQGIRNTQTSQFSNSFFGATLSITYYVDYYSYTIENVSAAHTLVLSDRPTYQLTATSTVQGQDASITPASVTVYEANPAEFVIEAGDMTSIRLLDNNTEVTTDIIHEDNQYKYIIDSVMAAHTIVLEDLLIVYLKLSGAWVKYSKIYKKVNGVWVQQATNENILDATTVYVYNS